MLERQQIVRWAKIRSFDVTQIRDGVYEYVPHRGWKLVQRLCFWILDKIGAYAQETVRLFERTPQENNDLLKALLGQEGQWIELAHRGEVAEIFMGPDDFKDLMRICEGMGMRPWDIYGRIDTRDRYSTRWHDIPIRVIPWMLGALLVPRKRAF